MLSWWVDQFNVRVHLPRNLIRPICMTAMHPSLFLRPYTHYQGFLLYFSKWLRKMHIKSEMLICFDLLSKILKGGVFSEPDGYFNLLSVAYGILCALPSWTLTYYLKIFIQTLASHLYNQTIPLFRCSNVSLRVQYSAKNRLYQVECLMS